MNATILVCFQLLCRPPVARLVCCFLSFSSWRNDTTHRPAGYSAEYVTKPGQILKGC